MLDVPSSQSAWAAQSLLSFQNDMALAGGVRVSVAAENPAISTAKVVSNRLMGTVARLISGARGYGVRRWCRHRRPQAA